MVTLVSRSNPNRGCRRCRRGSRGSPRGRHRAVGAGGGLTWARNNTGPLLEARFQTPTMPRHTTYFEIFLQRLMFRQKPPAFNPASITATTTTATTTTTTNLWPNPLPWLRVVKPTNALLPCCPTDHAANNWMEKWFWPFCIQIFASLLSY